MTDPQQALIYGMIAASVADMNMKDIEIADACVTLLQREDGLDEMFDRIRDALPERLRETAYALACDVVAADGNASQEELRLLEMMRHQVGIDRLSAAAIERGAAARYAHL